MGDRSESIQARLSAFDATMIVVSLVIGIGIFRTPALVAEATGTWPAFLGAWILGGLVSLAGALTFAEIGSRFPRAGGYYRVVADCYHPRVAFMLNWAQVLMQGAGAAGVAFIGAEYLSPLIVGPELRTPRIVQIVACALMTGLLALNYAGIKAGARTQNGLTLAKIAMLVGLVGAAFLAAPAPAPDPSATPGGFAWSGLVAALVAVFYTYGGYQNTINFGGDVRQPRRNLPIAVGVGMLIVVGLYLLVNAAYARSLGPSGIASAKLVAAEVARVSMGRTGEAAISLAIFLSAAGFVNATVLQIPRSYYAMAADGVLPRIFRHVDPSTQVQPFALAFFGATMLLPALFLGSFEKLLAYVVFTDALMLVVVASTIFVLRRRGTGASEPELFRTRGYPFVPATFIAVLLGVALHVLATETGLALAGAGIVLAGWPLFSVLKRFA